MKIRRKIITMLTMAVLMAGVASAGPYLPYEPDYRYDENSVHAIFINQAPGIPGSPVDLIDFNSGPANYPLAPIQAEGFFDGIETHIILPNFIDELPLKKMRIQMEFLAPVFLDDIFVDVIGFDSVAGPVPGHLVGSSDPFILDAVHYMDFEIVPNPDWEEIRISNHFDPPNAPLIIEIDTISIPEPATLGLLGLVTGGIYFARRFFVV